MTHRVVDGEGKTLATLPGRPLGVDLPPGWELVPRGNDYELYQPPGGFYCGSVVAPFVADGRLGIASIELAPPQPWNWSDVHALWMGSVRLRGYRSGSGGGSPWRAGAAEQSVRNLGWHHVQRCVDEAQRLNAHWPQRYVSSHLLVPVGIPLGFEDLNQTERQLGTGAREFIRRDGRLVPLLSDRTLGSTEPWQSSSVATAASAVVLLLQAALDRWGQPHPESVLGPLLTVRSRSMSRLPDVPPSSWPSSFQSFFASALETLTRIAPLAGGTNSLPLIRLWEMYEEWVAERILLTLVRMLGPSHDEPEGSMLGRWQSGGGEIALYFMPTFSADPVTIGESNFFSVLGERLIPDVLLAGTVNGRTRVLVIDAKDRVGISAGDLAAEASKYLWGVRRSHNSVSGDEPDVVPAIEGVVLVAPHGGASSSHLPLGKATSVHAAPYGSPTPRPGTMGQQISQTRTRDWLAQLGVHV